MVQEIVDKITMEIMNLTGHELSDYEQSFLSEGILFCKETTPNNYGIVMDAMERQTKLENDYNYLIYNLQFELEKLVYQYRSVYDNLFAQFTRSGLPNQAAVEAAVLSKDSNKLLTQKHKINRLEYLIAYLKTEALLIKSKGKVFDAKRSNTF